MRKMTTLYKQYFDRLPNNKGRVFTHITDEVRDENKWVFTDTTTKAYKKLDGTACAIIDGKLYARYMVRQRSADKPKKYPEDGIPAQPKEDPNTGQHPYWVPTDDKKEYKYHNEAFARMTNKEDGTYELCGPKINGNKENLAENILINHNSTELIVQLPKELTFESIKDMVSNYKGEGFVLKNSSGDMCKIRRCDFKLNY
jgi:hypothetical protein